MSLVSASGVDGFPRRTRIKVCGITSLVDAEMAVALGADALGFIFHPKSPRNIEADKAKDIISRLPPFVDAVGVFVNESLALVTETSAFCKLSLLQLHGEESPAFCRALSGRVLKAIRMGDGTDTTGVAAYAGAVVAFLLDSYAKDAHGGTGIPFDWRLIRGLSLPAPVILAGGISPENVGQAIRLLQPFAVDANSGVESSPGKKDAAKLAALFAAARAADTASEKT